MEQQQSSSSIDSIQKLSALEASKAVTISRSAAAAAAGRDDERLSYKFQRLREKLRQAVASGELTGKLPGERALARKYRVNAKTLSKALTDLAAEGLLERNIGRGTFVRNHVGNQNPADRENGIGFSSPIPVVSSTSLERCLLVCQADQTDAEIVNLITQAIPGTQIVHETRSLRPSFLSQFKAVIDFCPDTPASFLRDVVVRGASVVLVGREPSTYSMNAVLVDRALGATALARDLMLAGHTRFFAVERRGYTQVSNAIRKAALRYASEATVDCGFARDVAAAIENGITAIVCDSAAAAQEVRSTMESLGIEIPARASLAAVAIAGGELPCTGFYVTPQQKADAILQVLREPHGRPPAPLWLVGIHHEGGTIGPTESMRHIPAQADYDTATA